MYNGALLGRGSRVSSLGAKEFYELRDDLIGGFFHQPVPGIANYHAFHMLGDKPALLNQEIAGRLFAGQYKHRHQQGRLRKAGEVLRVLFEGFKVLEAGTHTTPPGIGFDVNPAVALRYRMGRVGGEIVPEMFKVDAFAAVNERERSLAVKVEMPKISHQPYVAPFSYTRQEGVH